VTAIVEGELRSRVVRLAAAGDEAAFAGIIEAHHDDMIRVAYLVTGEVELAHEAVQSAWLLAWRKLGGLRDEPTRS
jgi:DNA-directed RNA polymerase specialized sigma24 family protein